MTLGRENRPTIRERLARLRNSQRPNTGNGRRSRPRTGRWRDDRQAEKADHPSTSRISSSCISLTSSARGYGWRWGGRLGEAAPHRAGLFGGLCQPGAQLPSAGPVHGRRRRSADPAGGLLQRQEREEIPPGDRVRERPLGHPGRHRSLRRPGLLPERPPHSDGTDHHVEPPQGAKYARNKNILVIGGSGSGKTRFFVKPNLLQCHSSYVVTDPNGLYLERIEKGCVTRDKST